MLNGRLARWLEKWFGHDSSSLSQQSGNFTNSFPFYLTFQTTRGAPGQVESTLGPEISYYRKKSDELCFEFLIKSRTLKLLVFMFTHLSNMRTKVNTISCLTLYKGAEAISLNVKIITRCRSDTIEATYFQLTHKSQDHKDS